MKQVISLALLLVALNCLTLTQHADFTNILTLKFDYAPDENNPLTASSFAVSWNGVQLKEIFPKKKWIHAKKFTVTAKVG
jgi:hypothetical protein